MNYDSQLLTLLSHLKVLIDLQESLESLKELFDLCESLDSLTPFKTWISNFHAKWPESQESLKSFEPLKMLDSVLLEAGISMISVIKS